MVYRLQTFGHVRLVDHDGRNIPFPDKALVTLAYLLEHNSQIISRSELADILWPDSYGTDARANLRQLLARIKTRQQKLNQPLFKITGTELQMIDAAVAADLLDLKRAISDGPLAYLSALIAVARGEFLAGYELESEQGTLWIEATRSRMRSDIARCLEQALTIPPTDENWQIIKDAAYRMLELDSCNEAAYKALMSAFAGEGLVSQVKAHFARYKEQLWADLQTLPPGSMLDFAESLFGRAVPARPHISDPTVKHANELETVTRGKEVRLPRLLLLPPVDQKKEHLGDALIEDVTISLCRSRSLSVVAAHTAQQLAKACDAGSVLPDQHDVAYILATRLRWQDAEPYLFATLSDCRTDSLIWAEKFSLAGTQLSNSYAVLVRKISNAVVKQIESLEFARAQAAPKPDAYQHYLIGQNHLRRIDLPSVRRARKNFRSALGESANYGSAFSGMARTAHLEWLLLARGEKPLLDEAETLAMKAILADPDDAAGYRELGVAKLFLGQFDQSIEVFEAAEQSAPVHADLIADYADTLIHASNPKAGLEKITRAIELNPLCPDVYWWTAAGASYSLEQYEEALSFISNMKEQNATTRLAAACWGMLGDQQRSRALAAKTLEMYPDFRIDNWLSVFSVKEGWQRELYRDGLAKAGFR